LIIRRTCGRVMRERPGIPVYAIHDSVLTTPKKVTEPKVGLMGEFDYFGQRLDLGRQHLGNLFRASLLAMQHSTSEMALKWHLQAAGAGQRAIRPPRGPCPGFPTASEAP
jgi:hypothetical protein